MKTKLTILIAFALISKIALGQEGQSKKGSEIGFHLSQYQDDFGIGLDYTSPYLIKSQFLAFSFRANMMFLEHLENLETTWTPYYNLQLGVIGAKSEITKNIVIYGEGGVILILPDSDFSSSSTEFGGYGLFGFQFNFDPHNAYFLELGGVGVGATADEVPLNPIYSNGFLINVGYKVIF